MMGSQETKNFKRHSPNNNITAVDPHDNARESHEIGKQAVGVTFRAIEPHAARITNDAHHNHNQAHGYRCFRINVLLCHSKVRHLRFAR